jgi:hypothetical protein
VSPPGPRSPRRRAPPTNPRTGSPLSRVCHRPLACGVAASATDGARHVSIGRRSFWWACRPREVGQEGQLWMLKMLRRGRRLSGTHSPTPTRVRTRANDVWGRHSWTRTRRQHTIDEWWETLLGSTYSSVPNQDTEVREKGERRVLIDEGNIVRNHRCTVFFGAQELRSCVSRRRASMVLGSRVELFSVFL